ncbi:MAG: L-dopachrome tautomerase-related protein [Pseudomonadota bacterium]
MSRIAAALFAGVALPTLLGADIANGQEGPSAELQCTVSGVEVVAEMSEAPGNVAVTPKGRIIASLHQFYEPARQVVEILPDGSVIPFLDEDAAEALELVAVLGLQADRDGIVWMVDNGGGAVAPRVVAWNTVADELHRILTFDQNLMPAGAFPNDLAVDRTHGKLVLANSGASQDAGLVIVDLATGDARRALHGHPLLAHEDEDMVIDGRVVTAGAGAARQPVRIALNPITIDPTDTWIYFGAMSGTSLYRVRARDLYDEALSHDALASRVERHGNKPFSDGITIDDDSNVYVTDLRNGAVGFTAADGTYRILHDDARLSWPDGLAAGPDGCIYLTVNQLHRSAVLNGGEDISEPPFLIVRFAPQAPVTVGR